MTRVKITRKWPREWWRFEGSSRKATYSKTRAPTKVPFQWCQWTGQGRWRSLRTKKSDQGFVYEGHRPRSLTKTRCEEALTRSLSRKSIYKEKRGMFKSSINEGWWTSEAKVSRSLITVAVRTGSWRLMKKQEGEETWTRLPVTKSDQVWSRLKDRSQVKSEGEKPADKKAWTRSSTTIVQRRREAWRLGNLIKVTNQKDRSSLKARSQGKSEGGKPDGKETWKRLLTTKNDQDWSWEAWQWRYLVKVTSNKDWSRLKMRRLMSWKP